MSTIIAYTGNKQALPIMKEIIGTQLYKGAADYGIYVMNQNRIELFEGKVENIDDLGKLNSLLNLRGSQSLCYLQRTKNNAEHLKGGEIMGHYHDKGLALIFNGSVSNKGELIEFLASRGYDSHEMAEADILARLINENLNSGDYDLKDSISTALSLVEGEYALVAMATTDPRSLVAAMSNKPLGVGSSATDYLVSNQSRALLDQTKNVTYLNNNELAYLNAEKEISIQAIEQLNNGVNKLENNNLKQTEIENYMENSQEMKEQGNWSKLIGKVSTGLMPRSFASYTVKSIAFQLMLIYLIAVASDSASKMLYSDASATLFGLYV